MIFVILVYSFYYYFVLRKCIENLYINYYNLNFYILLIGFEMQRISKEGQKNLFSQNTML